MKNTVMEIYVNGVVSGRLQFREMPMQNYYDVNVCKNGGINGKISNLRYYNKALTIFEIKDSKLIPNEASDFGNKLVDVIPGKVFISRK